MAESSSRRTFLKVAGALAAAAAVVGRFAPRAAAAPEGQKPPDLGPVKLDMAGPVPRRALGKTGVEVSILGLGGYHLGSCKDEAEAARVVHEAIDHGVNFLDNAWEYHEGRSEDWMGKALEGRRDKVFLMTKVCTHGRDKAVAMKQLEESLRRLRTDHLDLWQVHEVIHDNDPDLHFRAGGVIEALDEARKQGKVRFVGFTGHKDPAIHLRMLAHGYPFDTVQMPLNAFDGQFRSFEQQVLPEAAKRGLGVIGMKSLNGDARAVKAGAVGVRDALAYAMSLPGVSTTVSGIDSVEVLHQNLNIVGGFKPLGAPELEAIRARTAAAAIDGRFELYKTSKKFDGAPGREQHGFPSVQEMPG